MNIFWWRKKVRSDSAKTARFRLRKILALDHVERNTRPATAKDNMQVFLDKCQPVLLLERFAKVEPMPRNTGQVIKWRPIVPFTTGLE